MNLFGCATFPVEFYLLYCILETPGYLEVLASSSFFPVFFFSPLDGDVKYKNAVIATATAPPTTSSSVSELDDWLSVEPLDGDDEVVEEEEDDDDNVAWSSVVSPKSGLIMSPSVSICAAEFVPRLEMSEIRRDVTWMVCTERATLPKR